MLLQRLFMHYLYFLKNMLFYINTNINDNININYKLLQNLSIQFLLKVYQLIIYNVFTLYQNLIIFLYS